MTAVNSHPTSYLEEGPCQKISIGQVVWLFTLRLKGGWMTISPLTGQGVSGELQVHAEETSFIGCLLLSQIGLT